MLGFLVQVTVWRPGGIRRKPSLGRIEQRQQQGAGWPKLAGADLAAAPEFERRGKEGYGSWQGDTGSEGGLAPGASLTSVRHGCDGRRRTR